MPPLYGPDVREKLRERLLTLYRQAFGGVAAHEQHLQQMAIDGADESRSVEQLERLQQMTGQTLAGAKMLEVGAGTGLTVAIARRFMDVEAYGIEPGEAEYDGTLAVAKDVLRNAGLDPEFIRHGFGEAIPFPDETFDIVFSTNVLEHVADPAQVVSEIVRVLKPGGSAQIIVPNYGSWWEGHYGLPWFPHMPAWLGKIYVRLFGRDAQFIDTLQLVSRGKLERWLRPHSDRVEVLDWGVALWEQRVRSLNFSEYSALARLKGILRAMHTLGVIPLLVWLGKALHWETPLVLTFRKRA
ncbi:Methyltransferase domain-containing protein [Bosea sp. TND4EK4]|nr:Methyltransferase domain-containing protein [Bosea sp. TND4EK4]